MRIVDDTPEPGLWRPVSPSEVTNWRKAAFERVAGGHRRVVERRDPSSGATTEIHGRGGSYMQDVIRTNETEAADHRGDDATVSVEPIRGIRQGRETVSILAQQTIDWVRSDPTLYAERLRIVVKRAKAVGALEHMSESEAMQSLHVLAQKIAEANAHDAYASVPQFDNHFWEG